MIQVMEIESSTRFGLQQGPYTESTRLSSCSHFLIQLLKSFVPSRLLERFERERREVNASAVVVGRPLWRVGLRRPRLALVFGDLLPDVVQLKMISIVATLKEIGYGIQVYSFEDGLLLNAFLLLHHSWFLLQHYDCSPDSLCICLGPAISCSNWS